MSAACSSSRRASSRSGTFGTDLAGDGDQGVLMDRRCLGLPEFSDEGEDLAGVGLHRLQEFDLDAVAAQGLAPEVGGDGGDVVGFGEHHAEGLAGGRAEEGFGERGGGEVASVGRGLDRGDHRFGGAVAVEVGGGEDRGVGEGRRGDLPEEGDGVVAGAAGVGEVQGVVLGLAGHLGGERAEAGVAERGGERLAVGREVGQRLDAVQRVGVGGELLRGQEQAGEGREAGDGDDGQGNAPAKGSGGVERRVNGRVAGGAGSVAGGGDRSYARGGIGGGGGGR